MTDPIWRDFFPNWQEFETIDNLPPEKLDDLPFGAIQLDPAGTILRYNMSEARISGRDPRAVLGKNFFEEVAPCTNVQDFAGRFREGVKQKNLSVVFPYLFDFEMKPTKVWVRLFYSQSTDTAWVFVRQRER